MSQRVAKTTMALELHEFFVEGGDQARSHVLLHITEPSTPEEQEKGYFFAVTEINNGSTEQIEHLQELIDDLEAGYYDSDADDTEVAFETTLEFINRRGHHVLQDNNSIVSCVVGILRGKELSLAYHGQPTATLLYRKNDDMGAVNILGEEDEAQEQLFSAVVEGNINAGDFVFISTPHVADYIGTDRLRKIIQSRPTRQSAEHIQKILDKLDNDISFGGLLMHTPRRAYATKSTTPKHVAPTQTAQKPARPTLSLGNIIRRGDKARPKPTRPKIETNYRPRSDEPEQSFFSVTLITLGRAIVAGFVGLYRVIKKVGLALGRGAVAVILLITNKGGQRQMVLQSLDQKIQDRKRYIAEMPLLSKILVLITIILAIIFAGSITYFKFKQVRETKQVAYQNHVQAIIDKKDAAEASMIYDDETKAFTLLQEANGLLASLSTDTKEQVQQKEKLEQDIEESLQTLRKVTTVTPELVVDLASVSATANATRLVSIDEILIAYGPNDTTLYRIDPDTKKVSTRDHSSIPNLAHGNTPKEQDKIVFLTTADELAEYQKESGGVVSRTFDIGSDTAIDTLSVYNQRLYSVDGSANQIYKHNKTATGFDRGSSWVAAGENPDLSGAVSLAIDGDIFVLKADGDIVKFAAGREVAFDIVGLDPALSSPTELFTYNDVRNIYILEPTNKRVVVLNKNGKLIGQYTAESWQGPTGMIVQEDDAKIFVLDSNKVYSFSL